MLDPQVVLTRDDLQIGAPQVRGIYTHLNFVTVWKRPTSSVTVGLSSRSHAESPRKFRIRIRST